MSEDLQKQRDALIAEYEQSRRAAKEAAQACRDAQVKVRQFDKKHGRLAPIAP